MAIGCRIEMSSPVRVGRVHDAADDAIGRLSGWLLVALALDLLLGRLVVRLAIFVPKGEPWATAGAVVGRIGAAADALVPIVAVLLLGTLLVRAGRMGSWLDRLLLVGVSAVGAAGFVLLVSPPQAWLLGLVDLLVVAIAATAILRVAVGKHTTVAGRLGLSMLGASVALAALGRLAQVMPFGDASAGTSAGWSALGIAAAGEIAFVAGAALVGVAGLVSRGHVPARWPVFLALVVALGALGAGWFAPAMWGALAIWSLGLTGTLPVVVLASVIGLAVAGLPALRRSAPGIYVGATAVLLSGHALAASGLVLAALVGLIVATSTWAGE